MYYFSISTSEIDEQEVQLNNDIEDINDELPGFLVNQNRDLDNGIQDEIEIIQSSKDDDDNDDSNDDESSNGSDSDKEKQFSSISFTAPKTSNNARILDLSLLLQWVLLWVFVFQLAYQVPKTAIARLITFLAMLLEKLSPAMTIDFPGSLYHAEHVFNMPNEIINYIICTLCHTLYDPHPAPLAKTKPTKCKKAGCMNLLTQKVKKKRKDCLPPDQSLSIPPYYITVSRNGPE